MNSREGERHINLSEEDNLGSPEVPKIFELINSRALTPAIVEQLLLDMNDPSPDMERAYLGLAELAERQDGVEALYSLSKHKGVVAEAAGKLARRPDLSALDLQNLLNINRWDKFIYASEVFEDMDVFKEVYEHGIKHGYIDPNLSIDKCYKGFVKYFDSRDHSSDNPHLSGSIEKQILTFSATFGNSEPSYTELLGPKEVLRLRTEKNPRFLLLGSLGVYSARDFENFAAKISPDINTHVIDIDEDMAKALKKDPANSKRRVVVGDARMMPFKDESMDHVYTNHLFHFFDDPPWDVRYSVEDTMSEAARVLKPGGSLVIVEQFFGTNAFHGDLRALEEEVDYLAGRHFKIATGISPSLAFTFKKESGATVIDKNGFGQYKGKMLEMSSTAVARRYTKE